VNHVSTVAHYRDQLSRVIRGRPWIVATDVLVNSARTGEKLLDLGADRVMAIGGARGTGALPAPDRMPMIELGVRGKDMMGGIRACEAALDAVPAEVQAQVDAFDPDREARVVRALFSDGAPVAGRATFGGRREAWTRLEDKMRVDALWDRIGIERAPSEIVDADGDAPATAAARLDRGMGTVWVADNREGWHGGAQFLRWVRSDNDAEEARRFLSAHADRVRVMPFLDGVPCSIHAIVFASDVIAFRPCEMLVFRVPAESRLAYAATSTFWLPPEEDREAMRDVARRVGGHLRDAVDFRGCLTVDGVLTEDGFRPTELNPRFGAALSTLSGSLPDLPLYLLHLAVAEGEALDYRPADLERLILDASVRAPTAVTHRHVPVEIDEPREAKLVRDADGFRWAAEGEAAAIDVTLGASLSTGSFLRLAATPGGFDLGPAFGPVAVEAFAFLDREWKLGIGPLEAARDVR
jgi:hypothetical protein